MRLGMQSLIIPSICHILLCSACERKKNTTNQCLQILTYKKKAKKSK
jgi:hypothetical protein